MLNIVGLHVAYGNKAVLRDINLQVNPGDIVAVIGPNGAGKTTLIRAVSGTVEAEKGHVAVSGKNVTRLPQRDKARLIAVVPQARQMGGAYSVQQAVMMGRTAHMGWLGNEKEDDRQAVRRALAQTNLVDFADRQIAKLSGGEQQRVLLARALAQDTPVLLLDEPTNHLDLRHQANLLRLIKKLAKDNQLAVLFAMHDLNLVSAIADRVILLVNGHISAAGYPHEILQAEAISTAYGLDVFSIHDPQTGKPIIFPQGLFDTP